MNRRLPILMLLVIISCSTDKQEPIFHPFESSRRYPNYDEVEFLKKEGFKVKIIDYDTVLTKSKDKIEILYVLIENEEVIKTKITRVHLNSFDTIQADIEIRDFGGTRITHWKIKNDSTLETLVSSNDNKIELSLIKFKNISYIETKSGFWSRIYNCF